MYLSKQSFVCSLNQSIFQNLKVCTHSCSFHQSSTEMEKVDDSGDKATLHLRIPFPGAKEAEIAYNSLRVDAEPKRSQVVRTLSVDGSALVIDLIAPDARQVRLSMNSLLDHVILVQKVFTKFSVKS